MQSVSLARSKADAGTYMAAGTGATSTGSGMEWQQEMLLLGLASSFDPSATSSTDHIALIGPYVMAQLMGEYTGLQESGGYSAEAADEAAERVAERVRAAVPFKTYELTDIASDSDTSRERVLAYRADLQKALGPLSSVPRYELDMIGMYVETRDRAYLAELRSAAGQYRTAASQAAAIEVPRDAVAYHLGVLGSLEYFASVLDETALHADDPFALVALLRSFDDAERAVHIAFDNLDPYYASKTL